MGGRISTMLHLFGVQTYATQTTGHQIYTERGIDGCYWLSQDTRCRPPARRNDEGKIILKATICRVFG